MPLLNDQSLMRIGARSVSKPKDKELWLKCLTLHGNKGPAEHCHTKIILNNHKWRTVTLTTPSRSLYVSHRIV